MANTKISALPANNNPTGDEELVYAYNNTNGKMTLDTMKTYASSGSQPLLVSGTNIKTINGDSILGSGNMVISGGGGGSVTELSGDANIWELSEGIYVTEYQLYYKSGEAVPAVSNGAGRTRRQMLFVTDDNGTKGYFAFSAGTYSSTHLDRANFGYSVSSSVGTCNRLKDWTAPLKEWEPMAAQTGLDSLSSENGLTQVIPEIENNASNTLRISSEYPPYVGMTYTIAVTGVRSGQTYSIGLGTGVTNPFNITLPSGSNKACVVTVLITSSTTGIVTGCTIAS